MNLEHSAKVGALIEHLGAFMDEHIYVLLGEGRGFEIAHEVHRNQIAKLELARYSPPVRAALAG